MVPENLEVYQSEHPDITLEVHTFKDRKTSYWITIGFGTLEMDEERFKVLARFLYSYYKKCVQEGLARRLMFWKA